jgi:monovalent cation:H+ antiporter-2, CPA2 family
VLANSEFRHQIEADLGPFKALLLGLFFITVGIGMDLSALAGAPVRILALTAAIIAVKFAILYALGIVSGLKGRDRWLFALSLAQAGEFGFLVIGFARSEGALPLATGQEALMAVSLSMLISPLLFILYDRIAARDSQRGAVTEPDEVTERGRVIIAGMGRFGQVVNRLIRSSGVATTVLDADMSIIDTMRRFGVKAFYGDPSRTELLDAAGLKEAEVLVVAIDDRANANAIVRHARKARPDLHIVARARDRVHVYELYQAGADDIVRETFDSSVRAGRYVLENMGFSEYEAAKLSQAYFRVDRAAMRDLAELWVPGEPLQRNQAYIDRAKQLDRDLETALIDELYETRPLAVDPAVPVPGGPMVVTPADAAPGEIAAVEASETVEAAEAAEPSRA